MNQARRNRIRHARRMLEDCAIKLEGALEILRECRDDETDAFEALRESQQISEVGENMHSRIDDLNDIIGDLDSFDIDGAVETLEREFGE